MLEGSIIVRWVNLSKYSVLFAGVKQIELLDVVGSLRFLKCYPQRIHIRSIFREEVLDLLHAITPDISQRINFRLLLDRSRYNPLENNPPNAYGKL